ncbi:hypothetical protein LTR15_009274 [Elasticomyces elasticus]|nr:hypothetical protein LTR15_009274 [Elasticomyces elasticus]
MADRSTRSRAARISGAHCIVPDLALMTAATTSSQPGIAEDRWNSQSACTAGSMDAIDTIENASWRQPVRLYNVLLNDKDAQRARNVLLKPPSIDAVSIRSLTNRHPHPFPTFYAALLQSMFAKMPRRLGHDNIRDGNEISGRTAAGRSYSYEKSSNTLGNPAQEVA